MKSVALLLCLVFCSCQQPRRYFELQYTRTDTIPDKLFSDDEIAGKPNALPPGFTRMYCASDLKIEWKPNNHARISWRESGVYQTETDVYLLAFSENGTDKNGKPCQ